ncbi:unnamed protein product [Phytophthora lilii]|uniref:Unnamed protein product n=1 Tax=Phytophthora lilii TaxID=2077276 RepID=A0A9W7D923_9STRA|nr:unnamed protein product [Phytophthora lilii]
MALRCLQIDQTSAVVSIQEKITLRSRKSITNPKTLPSSRRESCLPCKQLDVPVLWVTQSILYYCLDEDVPRSAHQKDNHYAFLECKLPCYGELRPNVPIARTHRLPFSLLFYSFLTSSLSPRLPQGYLIMRMYHVLLVATLVFYGSCEAVSNERSLRSGTRVVDAIDSHNEERAAVPKFTGVFRDQADMDKWLITWMNKKNTLTTVSKRLKVYNIPQDATKANENLKALLKYETMVKDAKLGKNYAFFNGHYYTKAQTDETIAKWIMADYSVKSAAEAFGVAGLSWKQLISHRNYNAFKKFLDDRKTWKRMVESNFETM